jgi:hypothetical protein
LSIAVAGRRGGGCAATMLCERDLCGRKAGSEMKVRLRPRIPIPVTSLGLEQ